MSRHLAALTALVALLAVSVIEGCGPTMSACSEANCGGCCDASGKCASGSTADSCGSGGARCSKCPTGAQCLQQVCTIIQGAGGGSSAAAGGAAAGGVASGGGMAAGGGVATGGGIASGGGVASGGGAATGGGTGGGVVNPGNCRVIANFTAPMASGLYKTNATKQAWISVFVAPSAPGSAFGIRGEAQLYRPLGATTFPISGTISPNTTFTACDECFLLSTLCDLGGANCMSTMLGRGGTYTFASATMNSLTGSAQNVVFQPWNLQTDTPVTSGEPCILIQNITYSATW